MLNSGNLQVNQHLVFQNLLLASVLVDLRTFNQLITAS